jgi:hypothetical protein
VLSLEVSYNVRAGTVLKLAREEQDAQEVCMAKPGIIKLVDARGNGMGYMVPGISIRFNGPYAPIDLRPKKAPEPQGILGRHTDPFGKKWNPPGSSTSSLTCYGDLRRANDDDEECPHCHEYPNRNNGLYVQTDEGEKWLIKCFNCRKLFLPF